MSTAFWIRRFLTVLAGAFVIICAAQLLKGHDWVFSVTEAAIWGTLSASLFTVARLFQARRGQHCALCKDTPAMQQDRRDEV